MKRFKLPKRSARMARAAIVIAVLLAPAAPLAQATRHIPHSTPRAQAQVQTIQCRTPITCRDSSWGG